MAITIKNENGVYNVKESEKIVKHTFTTTTARVKCFTGNADPAKMFIEKTVTLDGEIAQLELLTYLNVKRAEKLNGAFPVEILSYEVGKVMYEISSELFRKYGKRVKE